MGEMGRVWERTTPEGVAGRRSPVIGLLLPTVVCMSTIMCAVSEMRTRYFGQFRHRERIQIPEDGMMKG